MGGSPEPAEAIRTHAEQLSGEVLATTLHEGAPGTDVEAYTTTDDDLGLTLWLRKAA